MQSNKFIICRLVGKSWTRGATIEVLLNWGAATMAIAAQLARVAAETYGGIWAFAHEGETEFTVWLGFSPADFKEPVKRATTARKASAKKGASKAAKAPAKAPKGKATRKRKAS